MLIFGHRVKSVNHFFDPTFRAFNVLSRMTIIKHLKKYRFLQKIDVFPTNVNYI